MQEFEQAMSNGQALCFLKRFMGVSEMQVVNVPLYILHGVPYQSPVFHDTPFLDVPISQGYVFASMFILAALRVVPPEAKALQVCVLGASGQGKCSCACVRRAGNAVRGGGGEYETGR